MVPSWICDYAQEVGGIGVAVFTVLCIHASKMKRCFPSISTISKECGFKETAVKLALKKLVKYGLINILQKGNGRGTSNLYEIVDKLEVKGSPHDPLESKGSHSVAKGSPHDPLRGRYTPTNRSSGTEPRTYKRKLEKWGHDLGFEATR